QPVQVGGEQLAAQRGGVVLVEGRGPQLRLEHPLAGREVLPDRPGDHVPAAVGAAEDVDDVGDQPGDQLDVVDRQLAGAAQPVGGAQVGAAQPDGEDLLPVLRQQQRDLVQDGPAAL